MTISSVSQFSATNPAVYAINRLHQDIQETTYRIASGNRFYNAGDDPASLATSIALQTQVTSLRQALLNSAQANSVLQVAFGGLGSIGDILQEMKAIATQSSSGGLTNNERAFLDVQFQNLAGQIDTIATTTSFNGIQLLDGTGTGTIDFQIGEDPATQLNVIIDGATTDRLFNSTTPDVGTQVSAQAAAVTVGDAIDLLGEIISEVASNQSLLGFADGNLSTSIQGVDAARASLTDTDIPRETARFAGLLVQQQVGIAVTAQTQALSSSLLDLLRIQLKTLND